MSLPLQPLDFKDFSGGMTDNYFQSDIRRFQYADNFLITVDKKLELRDGTLVFDSVGYRLPSADQRVNSLFSFVNETILLAQSGLEVFVFPGAASVWTEILSPSGANRALPTNDVTSQVTSAEFQHQLYLTTEYSNGQLPVKLFRDGSNTWRSVTAGLPRTNQVGTSNYINANLLAKCIANANILKAALVAHMADLTQHNVADPAGATLNAVPNATNWATLQTLLTALSVAYESHRYDLAGPRPFIISDIPVTRVYHFAGTNGNMSLKMRETPNVVAKAAQNVLDSAAVQLRNAYKFAAAFLDDLLIKHNWHIQSPAGHESSPAAGTSYSKANATAHMVSISNWIGPITEGEPLVLPSYNAFVDMVTYLLATYNNHVLNSDNYYANNNFVNHVTRDFWSACPLDFPTDFWTAVAVLSWLRVGYGRTHGADMQFFALNPVTTGIMSATNGSPNVTSGNVPFLGPAYAKLVTGISGFSPRFVPTSGDQRDAWFAHINAAGGTGPSSYTATFDRNIVLGGFMSYQLSYTSFHVFYDNAGVISNPPSGYTVPTNQILYGNNAEGVNSQSFLNKVVNPGTFSVPADPYDLKSWNGFAEEFALVFGEHVYDRNVHNWEDFLDTECYYVKPSLTLLDGNDFYIPTIVAYSYAFQYQHNYTVETNGLKYVVNGNPVITSTIETCKPLIQGDNVATFDHNVYGPKIIQKPTYAAQISGIPAMIDSVSTNYDLVNIISQAYRTTDGSSTYYLLANLPLSTSTYTDYTSDQSASPDTPALVSDQTLYTNGGVVGADAPPLCKFAHFCNGFMYYGAITEVSTDIGGTVITQHLPNRLIQSVKESPDWAPATFSDDLDDAIVGISSFRSVPIAFCSNSVYRIENSFTTTGQGFISHVKISESVGALNSKSIVKTEVGVFYAATDGFYYTDGYQIIKVSLDLDDTYLQNTTATPAQAKRIVGTYDKHNRRVYWSMISNSGSSEPDVIFVFYLNFGIKPSGVFTRVIPDSTAWVPSSHIFWNGLLVIGDSRGYILKSDANTQTDPAISNNVLPSLWAVTGINYLYASAIFDYGSAYKKKYTPKIRMLGKNVGNSAFDISVINDANQLGYGEYFATPVKYNHNPVSTTPIAGSLDFWRRFPAGSLKSNQKQLLIKPTKSLFVFDQSSIVSFTYVQLSTVTSNHFVTLHGGLTWPAQTEPATAISFDIDEYVTKFPILNYAYASGVIQVADVNGKFAQFLSSSGGYSQGFRVYSGMTEQKLNISNLILQFADALGDVGTYGDDEAGTEG